MALSDYKNLQWLREGSDADWKKALEEQRLISMGKEALKAGYATPTERMITNPLSGGLEFLNVNPRYARQVSRNTANAADQLGITAGGQGGEMAGAGIYNRDPLAILGGTGIAVLGTVGGVGKKSAATGMADIVKSIESKKVTEGLGQFKSTKPSEIYNKTMGGGYSVNVPTGDIPNEGLMMGIYKNTDPRNKVLDKLTKKDIEQQYLANKSALDKQENYFGTWLDPESKKTYLDVSQKFAPNDLRKAVKFGERTNQIAGYNVGKGESFPVGNWNDYIKSNELFNRLHEANKWGADYLAQHPTVNWWDLKGTPIADVYGLNENPEGLKRMAGFLAATSPVSDVPRNARIGSEYYRRWLANEPVRQPNFRMPENSVFETAGNMMPMESGRANNLKAAYEGRINDLRNEKVNNMGLALMGDPNAVVLDRHMAAVMEDPSKNIFTAAEKGIFPSGKPYADAKNIFIQQAQQANPPLSPRDFSANVWTGYRNKAQQEGNAFGQKTSGAGIQGESKSIADTMMDQVKIKAQKLGIPFEEMVKKLRSGEISLLSLMPVGLGGSLLGSDNNK